MKKLMTLLVLVAFVGTAFADVELQCNDGSCGQQVAVNYKCVEKTPCQPCNLNVVSCGTCAKPACKPCSPCCGFTFVNCCQPCQPCQALSQELTMGNTSAKTQRTAHKRGFSCEHLPR